MAWLDRRSAPSTFAETARANHRFPVAERSKEHLAVAGDAGATTLDRAAALTDVPGEVSYLPVGREYPRAFSIMMTLGAPSGSSLDALNAAEAELNAGTAYAGVKMYMAIRQCQESDIAGQMRELEEVRENPAAQEALLARNEQTLHNCQGIGAPEIARGYSGLRQAADRGDIAAQLIYVSGGEQEFSSAREMIQSPEKIVRFRDDSMRYLNSAAARGSIQAMQILADAYENGVVTPQDHGKSYLYRYVDYLLAPGPLTQQLAERASLRLSPEQISEAQAQARRFLEKCCRGTD